MVELIFERLDKNVHDRDSFDCGVEVLNEFLRNRANKEMKQHLNSTYVASTLGLALALKPIAGYYTLSTSSLAYRSIDPSLTRHVPPSYPIPTARIGRLARDKRYPGIGSKLLRDALLRTMESSRHIGVYGVQVDAKDEAARTFYQKYGFVRLLDAPDSLFLPLKTIIQSIHLPA